MVLVVPKAAEPGLSGAAEDAGVRAARCRRTSGRRRSRSSCSRRCCRRSSSAISQEFGGRADPHPAAGRRLVRGRSRAVASIREPACSSRRCCAAGRRAPARARGDRPSTASPAARRPGASSRAAWRRWSAARAGRARGVRQPRRPGRAVMKLLVSVVDAGEARAAAAAGADIVDVKNPAEGSLGAPSPAVIAAVRAAVPTGAAGQRRDRRHAQPARHGGARRSRRGPQRRGVREGRAVGRLDRSRRRSRCCGPSGTASRACRATVVVAAAYADARRVAHAPLAPELLPRVARAAGVGVCLLDTAVKDGRGLLDWLVARRARVVGGRRPRCGSADGAGRRPARARTCRSSAPPAPTSPASARPPAATARRSGPLDAARVRALRAACPYAAAGASMSLSGVEPVGDLARALLARGRRDGVAPGRGRPPPPAPGGLRGLLAMAGSRSGSAARSRRASARRARRAPPPRARLAGRRRPGRRAAHAARRRRRPPRAACGRG